MSSSWPEVNKNNFKEEALRWIWGVVKFVLTGYAF